MIWNINTAIFLYCWRLFLKYCIICFASASFSTQLRPLLFSNLKEVQIKIRWNLVTKFSDILILLTTWLKHDNLHKRVVEYQQEATHSKLEELNNSVLVKMRKLNESFSKLEVELSVAKQVNAYQARTSVLVKRTIFQTEMSRHNDIIGIPREVESRCFGWESGSHFWEARI